MHDPDLCWGDLATAYRPPRDKPRSAGLALVLGAGVSKDCSLPDWVSLLQRVAGRCLPAGTDAESWLQHRKDERLSLPAIATLLEQMAKGRPPAAFNAPSGLQFAFLVREALYEQFVWQKGDVNKKNHAQFVKVIKDHNPTLAAIAGLCAVQTKPGSFAPNPGVRAIVTFNLDPILQGYVRARYRRGLLRTVERPSAGAIADKINIYHMHGMLRWDSKWSDPRKAAADSLVLTEQQYFDFFDRPNSLFNYTFLHILREHPCLFIGLSMMDDNLRRLLHYSYRERLQAYQQEGLSVRSAEVRSQRHFAILQRPAEQEASDVAEASLAPLGVRVLWIEQFRSDIPARLQELYELRLHPESAGFNPPNWTDVF